MQRFQVVYHLKAIPEAQEYLNVAFDNSKHHGDLQDLYRRRYVYLHFHSIFFYLFIVVKSLMVEPKNTADTHPTSDMRQLFSWATRFQPQGISS
jgi:son of sevenless